MTSSNKWTEEAEAGFIYHYQSTRFKENYTNSSVKANFKRQALHQLLLATQHTSNNEATCHILKTNLKDYSSLVDKPNGINNYAAGVLNLVPHNINDTKKWTSKANASELIERFLKPVAGDCFYKGFDGCLAHQPTKAQLEAFLTNKDPFVDNPKVTSLNVQPPKISKTFTPGAVGPNSDRQINQSSVRGSQCSWMAAVESRLIGPTKPLSKPPSGLSFRTAGTELRLQNAKKNAQGGDCQGYGSAKRSLGSCTRSINRKFVPPVTSDFHDDVSSSPNSCEEEDLRLRLIDPKLIELIRSEIMDHGPPVGWDDIAGLHFAKTTIQEIVVLPMLRPDIFTGLRRPPKGILLFGPPGTGKTLIGKCIASQSKSTFFNISASSLTSKWVGEGEKMVRTLFTLARVHQPSVVFIDEIDSLLSQRCDTEHESSRRIKTEFLVQLDGAGTGEEDRILVIGATNRPQELDEAARRRLVKRLYIPLPDHEARCHMVQRLMASERNVLTLDDLSNIASLTEGFSGADMKTVCQEACLGPIRSLSFAEMQHISPDQVRAVTIEDFTSALSRVRASVSPSDLDTYVSWDKNYGSGGAPK